MEKGQIMLIAQLLASMKDAVSRLDRAQKSKDIEKMNNIKKELLKLKGEVDALL